MNSNVKNLLLTFLGGAAVGIATGILFAPAKGATTRRKISRKTKHLSDSVKEKMEDLKDSMGDLIEEIEDAAEERFGNRS